MSAHRDGSGWTKSVSPPTSSDQRPTGPPRSQQSTARSGDVVIFRVDHRTFDREREGLRESLAVLAEKTGVEFLIVSDEVEVHVARGDRGTEAAA